MLLLLTATGCSPAGRMLAGGSIAAAGVGVTSAALDSMTECPRETRQACPSRYNSTPPTVAMPIAAAGLGIAFLGAVVMAQRGEHRGRPPRAKVAPPPLPAPLAPPLLDQTSAVGMAVARLSLSGIGLHRKPTSLLSVDDTDARLHIDGQRAELRNLRVRTTSDLEWRSVRACYERSDQWHVVRIGTGSGCAR